jgi:hypothetical protein
LRLAKEMQARPFSAAVVAGGAAAAAAAGYIGARALARRKSGRDEKLGEALPAVLPDEDNKGPAAPFGSEPDKA